MLPLEYKLRDWFVLNSVDPIEGLSLPKILQDKGEFPYFNFRV